MVVVVSELAWIVSPLPDVNIPLKNPPTLFYDNLTALYLTNNPIFHARTKHIKIDYHFVQEKVANSTLVTKYVPAKDQLADLFTRTLSAPTCTFLRSKLGLHDCSTVHLTGSIRATQRLGKKRLEEEDEGAS